MLDVSSFQNKRRPPTHRRVIGSNAEPTAATQFGGRVAMDGPAKPASSGKRFWDTVKSLALGGKKAGWFRKALGWLALPFVLVWKSLQWLAGFRSDFKDLHPLHNKSQQEIYKAIQLLDQQIEPLAAARLKKQGLKPEANAPVQFGFSWEDVQKAKLHKNHLIKMYDSRKGLLSLLQANDWSSTARALEEFLSANGKNSSNQSCMNISWTHAQALTNLAPMKRKALKESEIALYGEDTILDRTQTSWLNTNPNTIFSRDSESLKGISQREVVTQELNDAAQIALEEAKLAKRFGMVAPPKSSDADAIQNSLIKAGPGAQALLFDVVGPEGRETGHVTLLVNLGGQLYHIDNFATKSAQVSCFENWLAQKQPHKLFIGHLKNKSHPVLAQG